MHILDINCFETNVKEKLMKVCVQFQLNIKHRQISRESYLQQVQQHVLQQVQHLKCVFRSAYLSDSILKAKLTGNICSSNKVGNSSIRSLEMIS